MRTKQNSDGPEVVRAAMLPPRTKDFAPNHIRIQKDHAEIVIGHKGRMLSVLIDHADVGLCMGHRWRIGQTKYGYRFVQSTVQINAKRQTIRLARVLLGLTDSDIWVDHEDGDPLNNRRYNLRLADAKLNAQNRRSPGVRTLPRGVSRMRSGLLRVRFQVNGRERYVGIFSNVEEAEIAAMKARAESMPYDRTSAHYRRQGQ